MWGFATKQKITAAVILSIVLCLVILMNIGERRNAEKINIAVTSIYHDRLLVEGYIFELSHHLKNISDIIGKNDLNELDKTMLVSYLDEISRLNALYAKTKLTESEKTNFEKFRELAVELKEDFAFASYAGMHTKVDRAENILHTLSNIQMEEAKNQMRSVLSTSNFSSLISYVELIILIVIAMLIQILIFSRKILKVKIP